MLLTDEDVEGPGCGCTSPAISRRQYSHVTIVTTVKQDSILIVNIWLVNAGSLFTVIRVKLKNLISFATFDVCESDIFKQKECSVLRQIASRIMKYKGKLNVVLQWFALMTAHLVLLLILCNTMK